MNGANSEALCSIGVIRVLPGFEPPWGGAAGASRASTTSSLRVISTTPSGAAAAGPAGPTSAISSKMKRLSPAAAADPAGAVAFSPGAEPAGRALADAGALAGPRAAAEGGAGGGVSATPDEALDAGFGEPWSLREQPTVRARAAANRAGRYTPRTLPRPPPSRQGWSSGGPCAIRVAMSGRSPHFSAWLALALAVTAVSGCASCPCGKGAAAPQPGTPGGSVEQTGATGAETAPAD